MSTAADAPEEKGSADPAEPVVRRSRRLSGELGKLCHRKPEEETDRDEYRERSA
ncbi:hypothetical protein [Nocardia panacis]|uniref:hypothetical protein n=1 Tax=Nocardia panacis TaxID=2340916 RepID=UPI0013156E72|nr:hypothetical protein [Nocardia panacis]